MDAFGKFVQAFHRVATFHTLQSGQPIFNGAHHAE
jgi:hypothetical protein